MTFGEFARRKRIEAGISQQVCAEAIGLKSRSAFHKLEDGERLWKLRQLTRFAELLDMRGSELLAEFEQL